ncbi:MiaB/RimO family radical SAM methylthiotransferase [Spirochaeta africana]|uniref:Radical SAM methylthiotransferase, MiaB/RimO family n=1 Tax=Spirochaeta africana (strain ATCC 700263 / DSM 8902 / Z-7692) TaxID=889378 RepID=H9UIG0_SPIAZ|nr:MiaB/RimO family radical SAM methylthiotransferase [Spirochaeta africana]AFG37303.1 radical SAM methylthiotransferase, MiaB/RimO family [Spirochaeta africana DSM 8902]
MRSIAFGTLGCKLNQYEADSLAAQFAREGYRVVDFSQPADCYIINTCTVTNKADRKSRNTINKAVRMAGLPEADVPPAAVPGGIPAAMPAANAEAPGAITVITGCFVDSHREELERSERLTYVVENVRKAHIFDLVHGHFQGEIVHPQSLPENLFSYEVADRTQHTRALVKVQDGCDNFCTFCIIPFVRGRGTSRPLDDILADVRTMVDSGYREIVLTGVNMSRYDHDGKGFADVVEAILETPGDFRVRISSLEPDQLDERFLAILGHAKMCPHLHLCLQSGSERVLLQMRRMYSYDEFRSIAEELRRRYPGFNLTTDIIVGFPGESEEDFTASCKAVREVGFGHVHLFPYSVRQGTRAERMPGHLKSQEKKRRIALLQELAATEKQRYRESLIGTIQTVLVEKVFADGTAQGYGQHYCPVRFALPAGREVAAGTETASPHPAGPHPAVPHPAVNEFFPVKVTGLCDGSDDGSEGPLLTGSLTHHLVAGEC